MITDNSRLHALQSIEFDRYKSFSEGGPFRIKAESNLTLIIGRNNCGKSSLIDIIEGFVRYKNEHKLPTGMQGIGATFTLSEDDIEYGFDRNTNSSLFGNHYKFGSQFIGKGIALSCTDKGMKPSNTQEEIFLSSSPKGSDKLSNWETIARKIENGLRPICFRRVNADRDVVPETESDVESVGFNGDGATNIIRKFINNYFLDESIVEYTILNELNKIMQPDAHFSNIRIQQVKGEEDKEYKWEVFLEENEHRYALSKSGSGLKTILLILINLFLVPQTKECIGKDIVFAFEEIENNLHPALQRRIFQYLYDYAVENNSKIFITSHSHIAINTFYNKDHASIIHIMKDKGSSCLQIIESGRETAEILDDGSLADDGSIYVWHADTEGLNFRKAFADAGFYLSGCCIWKKNALVLGRSPYQWIHEPCLFGWKKGGRHQWYADRKQTTVWEYDKPRSSKDHPTMKPVTLMSYPIKNSTMTNGIVLDPFLGSGSTLIACMQTDRVCRGIELDPKFVDVIVKRFIQENGGRYDDVYVIRDGQKLRFDEVATFEPEVAE